MLRFILVRCIRVCEGAMSRLRNYYYKGLGVKIDGYIWMRAVEIPRNWSQIALESPCGLDRGVTLLAADSANQGHSIVIGKRTYINRFSMIDASKSVVIGANCMIGPYCYITDSNHGMEPNSSIASQPMSSAPVKIGEGVWLGAHAVVLRGVTIGDGAVISAGSVVTKSIPAMAIAAGSPARVVGSRLK
jgi:acetyltransferase-like isoleucine patch superfamily enzyme